MTAAQDKLDTEVVVSNQASLTKWAGRLVLTGVIAVCAFFLEESYRNVQMELRQHEERISSVERSLVASQEDRKAIREILRRMEESDVRIESKLDRLIARRMGRGTD